MLTKLTMLLAIYWVPAEAKVSTWPLNGLHYELNNIAGLESQYGKYLDHRVHPLGAFHTAFGSLGLKPSTAHWTYIITPKLQKQFPDLQDERAFLKAFWSNRELYMQCANAHWRFLRASTPTLSRAVYAWRWGLTASNMASDIKIDNDTYVIKYVGAIVQ